MEANKEGGARQRFYIELKPDETTIVSWKKLLKDAANKAQPAPPAAASSSAAAPAPAAAAAVETIPALSAQQTHESQFSLVRYR